MPTRSLPRLPLAALALAALWPMASLAAEKSALVEGAVAGHIEPAYERLAAAAEALKGPAAACDADALRTGYNAAFDAWMGVQHVAIGPVEADMRRFSIAFWPDAKGFTRKALNRLETARDPAVDDPEAFARISVAAHGLLALERVLYDQDGPRADSFEGEAGAYRCRLAQAMARDMTATTASVAAEWRAAVESGEYQSVVPGAPADQARALFTTFDSGFETLADLRLGRPLGSLERPRPTRAEAWRSGRSTRNVRVGLRALEDFYRAAFAPGLSEALNTKIASAFARAHVIAERTPDDLTTAVVAPQTRIRVEALQTAIRGVRDLFREYAAAELGVSLGFNSMDGD